MILSEDEILERVDEYTLYCFYLEFQPDIGINYSSPLRTDRHPSFSLYNSRKHKDREYMWKDNAKGLSGDIFNLVKHLYPKHCNNKIDAIKIIMSDFKLGAFMDKGDRVITHTAKPRSDVDIKISSMRLKDSDIEYFHQFNVSPEILARYNATAIHHYWLTKDQQLPSYTSSLHPGYAYRIWDKYQLYFPLNEKQWKFRGNYDDRHLPGFLQLKYQSDLLIITKATKDIMMFDSFNYEAVSSRGEWTRIPEMYMDYLKTKYKRIVVWQDNDGKTGADKYYPELEKLYVPIDSGEKDPTDFCKRYGSKETLLLIKQLTGI